MLTISHFMHLLKASTITQALPILATHAEATLPHVHLGQASASIPPTQVARQQGEAVANLSGSASNQQDSLLMPRTLSRALEVVTNVADQAAKAAEPSAVKKSRIRHAFKQVGTEHPLRALRSPIITSTPPVPLKWVGEYSPDSQPSTLFKPKAKPVKRSKAWKAFNDMLQAEASLYFYDPSHGAARHRLKYVRTNLDKSELRFARREKLLKESAAGPSKVPVKKIKEFSIKILP